MIDPHLDDNPSNAHAPAGYVIYMQFFHGETSEEAFEEVVSIVGHRDIKVAPGHFDWGEDCEQEPVFRPYGWMTFVPQATITGGCP
jgi:hypothetical protein